MISLITISAAPTLAPQSSSNAAAIEAEARCFTNLTNVIVEESYPFSISLRVRAPGARDTIVPDQPKGMHLARSLSRRFGSLFLKPTRQADSWKTPRHNFDSSSH